MLARITAILSLLLLLSTSVFAQTTEPSLQNWTDIKLELLRLKILIGNSQKLIRDLETQISELQTSLATSEELLRVSELDLEKQKTLLTDLLKQLSEYELLLASQQADYEALIKKAEDQHNAEVKQLSRQKLAWKIGFFTVGIITVAESTYIIGHSLKWW